MIRLTIVGLTLLATIGSAYADQLSSEELQSKIVGHTLKWKSEKFNGSGTTIYNADGTVTISPDGGEPMSGTWKIKKGQFCVKMPKQKEDCGGPMDQVDDNVFYQAKYQSVVILK